MHHVTGTFGGRARLGPSPTMPAQQIAASDNGKSVSSPIRLSYSRVLAPILGKMSSPLPVRRPSTRPGRVTSASYGRTIDSIFATSYGSRIRSRPDIE